MNRNENYANYLGLPPFTGHNKQRLFDCLKERVWKKVQGWKSKLFSIGGREVLIKAVAQAIPSYSMSMFRLPVILCNRLKSMMVNFCWGANGNDKCIHWRKWKLLCKSKMQGGMDSEIYLLSTRPYLLNRRGELYLLQTRWWPRFININIFHLPHYYTLKVAQTHHLYGGVYFGGETYWLKELDGKYEMDRE